tara:strand:- start:106 stop:486 length:381 start_codon:yes stop_codon:yes gene_type:complete
VKKLPKKTSEYILGLPILLEALFGLIVISAAPDTATSIPILCVRDNCSPRKPTAIIVTNTGYVWFMGTTLDTSSLLMPKNISISPAPHIAPENIEMIKVVAGGFDCQGNIINIISAISIWIKPTMQ